jgi:hypothetical protein
MSVGHGLVSYYLPTMPYHRFFDMCCCMVTGPAVPCDPQRHAACVTKANQQRPQSGSMQVTRHPICRTAETLHSS